MLLEAANIGLYCGLFLCFILLLKAAMLVCVAGYFLFYSTAEISNIGLCC